MAPTTPSSTPRRSSRASKPVSSPVNPLISPTNAAGPSRRGVTTPNAIAGPSTPRPRPSRQSIPATASQDAPPSSTNGANGGIGRRVLPARIRRAAGGGQEGIRDLEEMIVDWLERWGAPSDEPPDNLPLYLTTLPLELVDPPVSPIPVPHPQPIITLTPTKATMGSPPSRARLDVTHDFTKIETPGWTIVKPGDDDAEEARLEMGSQRKMTSPLKRLRRLAPDEGGEDTSDAYYISLHRKYEIFERRQRIREKEKLNFERYKMKSRIELLKNMSDQSWAVVVAAVLSREGDQSWERGREILKENGVGWLRDKLVREGKDLVRRYDQLLPVEPRKQNNRATSISASTPTPERTIESSPRLSSSPAPVLPARVTALRDPASQKKPRTSTSSRESPRQAAPSKPAKEELVSEYDDPSILLPRKRKRPSNSQPKLYTQTTLSFVKIEPKIVPIESELSVEPHHVTAPTAHSDGDPPLSIGSHSPSPSIESFQPPSTASGLPCLIEAASRREAAIEEAEAARAKVEARMIASQGGEKVSRIRAREKTRTSGRIGTVLPFGLPFPPVLEWKSEFTITDEEDFWSIIAEREAIADRERRGSMVTPMSVENEGDTGILDSRAVVGEEVSGLLSKDDLADMKEVEAVVVL